ncbi:LOW QUALITY PROTEIN: retinitis pigmentosa 1-like 1 protein [Colossoma macropomum]|uniref:LOW QUALITY PROTEIN: retinitis pigmentosa 1-like 1 protein n=1 Tax=Colossoma macropomum TaxID=42526 RepID=UPI0018640E22|nr:LOW QUALITY PROTEIN: retinitis pigmentosa 1-like 1 protein [Colossoma macropomum]
MASHKRSFQCFDAIVDNYPQKPSFSVGHRFAAPQKSSHSSTRLEPLEDRGCYLCADHQQAKPTTSEASGTQSTPWYQPQTHHHSPRRPARPDGEPAEGTTHEHHHHHHSHSKRIVLVKNSDPSIQKTIVLHRRTVRSLGVFLDDVSELMQCLIRKLFTLEGRKIDSIQSLLQCPSILVCVGREPFHPLLLNSFRKNSDDKLPKLVLKSRSSACNEEQGFNFGLETKKSIIHPRSNSNDKSARLSMSSEKSFPHILNSVPPRQTSSYSQARESVMDDDIEKRVLVNKDGSLSMEMKVRFRLLNDETLHWSTEIKKSSGMVNESFMGYNDAYYLQHSNSESCSEAESLFCCEEYTEQVLEKATCIQQTVGEEGETTVEYCTISRCCSRSEACSVKKAYTEEKYEKVENSQITQEEERPLSVESNSSQVLASLKEDQDEEETDLPPSNSRASQSNNQDDDEETRDVALSPHSVTSFEEEHTDVKDNPEERTTSAMSSNSNISARSRQSKLISEPESSDLKEENNQIEDRSPSKMSVKSNVSAQSKKSNFSEVSSVKPQMMETQERKDSSAMSEKSNQSDEEKEERVTSALSTKSHVSVKSNKSKKPKPATETSAYKADSEERDVSDKTSEKSSKCRNRKGSSSQQKADDEISELVPSNLPNTSPTEVVNEWLNKIPLDSALYEVGDEFHENCKELETLNRLGEPTQNEKENESEGDVEVAVLEPQIEKEAQMATKEMDNNDKEEEVKKMTDKDLKKNQSCPEKDDVPKSFHSSVQVMRILLSPKLDRCNSLPEVSTVYGQKLSTSARGLLDCLVNLQLIDFDPNDVNGKAEKYKDLMNMLQSLWLCDPSDRMTVTQKSKSSDQQSGDDELKAKSSSGVDVSSGSTGSGKSSVNDSTQAQKSQTNTEGEGPETLTKVQEVDEIEKEEALEVVETNSDPATPDIASRVQWTPETEAEGAVEERIKDGNIPTSDDTIRSNDSPGEPLETPPSSNKSAGNEHQEETSSGTPPSVQRAPLTKRVSQDPDPVWVLNLLNKLEKQFMTHYVNAMAEFKVRWNLDDNEQLDVMICELRDEVHKRIQSSIDRELRKIQGRAGKPKPPKEAMSRESTIQTEQRRRRLKVMLNQSIDPATKSDDDYTATGLIFSDQRSDDEYCPCDTCMKKKMASKPVLPTEALNSAPAMMEFDLRKILQLKREAPASNKENIIEGTGNEELNTEDAITDCAESHEVVDTETEKLDINEEATECETEIDKCTVEAETSVESKTDKQEFLRELDTPDEETAERGETAEVENVETAKVDTVAEEEIAEGGLEGEETVEADEAEVAEDVEEVDELIKGNGSEEGDAEGEVQPPDTELAEEIEANMARGEDKESEEADKAEIGEDETSEPKSAEFQPTKESETPDQITDEHTDAETLEKNETPEGDLAAEEDGETAAEIGTVETTNAEIADDEEEAEYEVAEEKEFLKEGTGEEEDTLEPKKQDITHCEETDGDESVEGKDTTEEETTGEETVEDGIVDEEKISETAEDGEATEDESAAEFTEITKDGEIVNDGETTKLETAEEEEMTDQTAEDTQTDKAETAEEEETAEDILFEETADDKTQEDRETTNDETAEGEEAPKAEIAENGERTNKMTVDSETTDDGTSMDEETADNETAEDDELAEVRRVEDGETTDEETPEDRETSDGEVAKEERAEDGEEIPEDDETDDDETAQDGETSKADIAEDGGRADETGGDEKNDNNGTEEDEETAEDGEITDDRIADKETGNDEATENEETGEAKTAEHRDTADEGTVEDEEASGAEIGQDGETAEDGEAADDGTADDETGHEEAEDEETAGNEKRKREMKLKPQKM